MSLKMKNDPVHVEPTKPSVSDAIHKLLAKDDIRIPKMVSRAISHAILLQVLCAYVEKEQILPDVINLLHRESRRASKLLLDLIRTRYGERVKAGTQEEILKLLGEL